MRFLNLSFLISITILFLFASGGQIVAAEENIMNINVTDFGANGADLADDTIEIQNALNEAQNYSFIEIVIPDGTYLISKTLKINSNTRLILSSNATVKRNGYFSPMLINNTKGAGGYDGNENITIEGGTWDGNKDNYKSRFGNIIIGHAQNITIKDTKILNNYEGHHIEFTGVKNGQVLNCYIEGYEGFVEEGGKKNEAIQLDITHDSFIFPPFGNYDDTPCKGILIQGNTIKNGSRGVGSHSYVRGVFHSDIVISNNHFENIKDEGINALNYRNLVVKDNKFINAGLGIEFLTVALNPKENYDSVISDNQRVGVEPFDNNYHVEISNNLIQNTYSRKTTVGDGIIVRGTKENPIKGAVVKDNLISNCANDGIYLAYVSDSEISTNTINSCGRNGISVHYYSLNNVLNNNLVSNNKLHGISVFYYSNSIIRNNKVANNRGSGVSLSTYSSQCEIRENEIENSGRYGVVIRKLSNKNKIVNNKIKNSGDKGILLFGAKKQQLKYNSITKNKIEKSKKDGIYLEYASNNQVLENIITYSGLTGISLNNYSRSNTVKLNKNQRQRHGIQVQKYSNANIKENQILNSSENGIFISNKSTKSMIDSNKISSSGRNGIFINNYSNANVKKNKITKSKRNGIMISMHSVNSSVRENRIADSGNYGISLSKKLKFYSIKKNAISRSGRKHLYIGG